MLVKSKKAALITGLHPHTLRKYGDSGVIPCKKDQRGNRLYDVSDYIIGEKVTICYARVSQNKQKEDLKRQVQFLNERYPSAEIVQDIGSGLNFKRKGLLSVLERAMQGECITLVVAYKDRLARFGFDLIEWCIERTGGKVVVLGKKDTSPSDELVNDLMAIITVFSSRLHGLRSYRNKIKEYSTASKRQSEEDS